MIMRFDRFDTVDPDEDVFDGQDNDEYDGGVW
jgi:hypothetical protein